MSTPASDLRGIGLMVLATASFVTNDTFMKMATADLPPLEVLFLRGVWASLWCFLLVVFTGRGRHMARLLDKWMGLRNVFEVFAVTCFVIGLANLPIADITAMGQTAPMLLLLGVAVVYGEKIGWLRIAIIALGFVGAMMIVQPGSSTFTPFALLGFGVAAGTAARDVVVRKIDASIPGLVVTLGTNVTVMLSALAGSLLFEDWLAPSFENLALLCGSGLFLTIGHVCIFTAYRVAHTGAVAPFFYTFTVWALISGVVVFGVLPNALAIGGIVLIVASGVTVVLLDRRRRRLMIST